jgi:amidase
LPTGPPWQWSAVDVVAATTSGQVSCAEVARSVVERIADTGPAVNAVTLAVGEAAVEAARALDTAIARGEQPGPLHGVPLTIKDNVDVAGQRTPNGLPGLAGLVATDDSPVTRSWLGAGGVLVGRTNTPEVSMRPTTDNPLYGLTLNPWSRRVSAGGSSGGAGVSAAMGFGALAHGNDIGGSVRIPALHCGVPGIKPSQGRVPAYVPSAAAERPTVAALMSVQGVLARSVADVRLGLAVMARRDVRDPWWVPAPLAGPPVPRRAAVLRHIEGEVATAPGVLAGIDRAAAALAAAGYEVVELDESQTPGVAEAARLAVRLLMNDLDHQLTPVLDRLGSPAMRDYWAALRSMARPYASVGEHVDDLATRTTLVRRWLAFLEEFPVLVAPLLLGGVLEVGEDIRSDDDARRVWHSLAPSIAVNLLGLPSALAPTGLDGDGVPGGVQLIGSRLREDVCLDAAQAVEDAVGPLAPLLWEVLGEVLREGSGR